MDSLFNKFKKQVVIEKKKSEKKTIPSWVIHDPPTKYDKYFMEGRPINAKKRQNAWFRLSGGEKLREEKGEGYYKLMLDAALNDHESADAHQISIDIKRTSINDCDPLNEEQQESLFHVLKATAYECKDIGYCQSMNFLAAFLLRYMTEEQAFYTLICIYTTLLPDYWVKNLIGVRVDEQVFVALLNKKNAELVEHFDEMDVDITIVIFHWFLCLFINILKVETVEYIWDQLFYYGPHVIHAVCYRIFDKFSYPLLSCNGLEEIVELFNSVLPSLDTSTFSELGATGITLSQVRIERNDFREILKEEDSTPSLPKEVIQQDNRNISIRQSIRASFRVDNVGGMPQPLPVASAPAESETSSPLTKNLESRFKNNNSIVLSRTQLNNMTTYLRTYISKMKGAKTAIEYCEIGMTKDEFMSFCNDLTHDIGIANSVEIFANLFEEFKNPQNKVDIRQVISAFVYSLDDKDIDNRLLFFFTVYDIDGKNYLSKQDLKDLISTVYAMYPSLPNSSSKDIEISINSIFIMKKGDNQGLFFFEFKNMCLYHPFLNSYFGLLINDIESQKQKPKTINMRASLKDMRKQVRGSLASITDFDPLHDRFFQILPTLLSPEYQLEYERYRSELEKSVNRFKEMKEQLDEKSRELDQMLLRFSKANHILKEHNLSINGPLTPVDFDDSAPSLLERETNRTLDTISEGDDKEEEAVPSITFTNKSIKDKVKMRSRTRLALPQL